MSMPLCRKCLIEDMDLNAFYQNIIDYIKAIPEDKRIDDIIYKHRLDICHECEHLSNAMCAKCGCYVQLRAVKPNSYCAGECKKW